MSKPPAFSASGAVGVVTSSLGNTVSDITMKSTKGTKLLAHAGPDDDSDKVQREREQQEHQHRCIKDRPRLLDVWRLRRKHENMIAEVHELIAQFARQRGHIVRHARKQNRRYLPCGAAHRENAARHDARQRLGNTIRMM